MTQSAITSLQALPHTFEYINEDTEEIPETISNQVDDCFASMSSDWQGGNYLNIVESANKHPIYCLCDIRISAYYLYSLWVSQNDITSETVLTILTSILSHRQAPWRVSLPNQSTKSVNKVLSNSVTLLLRKITHHLENPKTQDRIWQETPSRVLKSLRTLHITINEQLDTPIDELENVFASLQKCYSSLEQQALGKNNEPASIPNVIENNTGTPTETIKEQGTTENNIIDDSNLVNPMLFKPSHALKQLFKHILLFQELVDQQAPLKAAVVLNDIQQELDNFNPLHYFPEYFTSFARLRAKHAANLEPLFEQQHSYQWKVLSECYKTNIHAFLTLNDEHTGLEPQPYGESFDNYGDEDYHE